MFDEDTQYISVFTGPATELHCILHVASLIESPSAGMQGTTEYSQYRAPGDPWHGLKNKLLIILFTLKATVSYLGSRLVELSRARLELTLVASLKLNTCMDGA